MNIIQNQAEKFTVRRMKHHKKYQEFLSEVRSELLEYKKDIHKIEFVEHLILRAKQEYEDHLPSCTKPDTCRINQFFENTMFF